MILLDGAQEVDYNRRHEISGVEQIEGLSYFIDAEFPAERVICHLTTELARAGWRALGRKVDYNGPYSSWREGWRAMPNILWVDGATVEHQLDRWHAEWVNTEGDLLSYELYYQYPKAGPVNRKRVHVNGVRMPAWRMTSQEREEIRAEAVPAGQPPHLTATTTASCR